MVYYYIFLVGSLLLAPGFQSSHLLAHQEVSKLPEERKGRLASGWSSLRRLPKTVKRHPVALVVPATYCVLTYLFFRQLALASATRWLHRISSKKVYRKTPFHTVKTPVTDLLYNQRRLSVSSTPSDRFLQQKHTSVGSSSDTDRQIPDKQTGTSSSSVDLFTTRGPPTVQQPEDRYGGQVHKKIQSILKTKDLEAFNVLGTGGFGKVFDLGQVGDLGEFVIKIPYKLGFRWDLEEQNRFLKEHKGPGLVASYGLVDARYRGSPCVGLILEKCRKRAWDKISTEHFLKIAQILMQKVSELNKKGVYHKDISEMNVMHTKLIDPYGPSQFPKNRKSDPQGLADVLLVGRLEEQINNRFIATCQRLKKMLNRCCTEKEEQIVCAGVFIQLLKKYKYIDLSDRSFDRFLMAFQCGGNFVKPEEKSALINSLTTLLDKAVLEKTLCYVEKQMQELLPKPTNKVVQLWNKVKKELKEFKEIPVKEIDREIKTAQNDKSYLLQSVESTSVQKKKYLAANKVYKIMENRFYNQLKRSSIDYLRPIVRLAMDEINLSQAMDAIQEIQDNQPMETNQTEGRRSEESIPSVYPTAKVTQVNSKKKPRRLLKKSKIKSALPQLKVKLALLLGLKGLHGSTTPGRGRKH